MGRPVSMDEGDDGDHGMPPVGPPDVEHSPPPPPAAGRPVEVMVIIFPIGNFRVSQAQERMVFSRSGKNTLDRRGPNTHFPDRENEVCNEP